MLVGHRRTVSKQAVTRIPLVFYMYMYAQQQFYWVLEGQSSNVSTDRTGGGGRLGSGVDSAHLARVGHAGGERQQADLAGEQRAQDDAEEEEVDDALDDAHRPLETLRANHAAVT